ncbi:Sua5/YciO/YrdC/YwlC family protein [Candidatus Gracilibacteria bacterium]|nr:Sua5/YciO/YrdC/YwlC family protein [Candidatus Gracilibacteria bacterium]
MRIFSTGEIWAYPTDTSFGLGVRADDEETLEKLAALKGRSNKQYFSLMVRDLDMLKKFAEVLADFPTDFFMERPRTAILKPTLSLPKSKFWPEGSVAFRVATIPEVSEQIDFPITATSANLTGQESIFDSKEITDIFGEHVKVFPGFEMIEEKPASEIWDFTKSEPKRVR